MPSSPFDNGSAITRPNQKGKNTVTHAYAVSKNILALRIETGKTILGTQQPYESQPGDIVDGGSLG